MDPTKNGQPAPVATKPMQPIHDVMPPPSGTASLPQNPKTGSSVTAAPDPVPTPNSQTANEEALKDTNQPTNVPQTSQSNVPVGAIIIAIIVATALAAITILTYLKTKK